MVLYTTVGGVVTEVFTGPWEVGVRAPLLPSRYGRTGARLEVMLLFIFVNLFCKIIIFAKKVRLRVEGKRSNLDHARREGN